MSDSTLFGSKCHLIPPGEGSDLLGLVKQIQYGNVLLQQFVKEGTWQDNLQKGVIWLLQKNFLMIFVMFLCVILDLSLIN